MTKMEENIGKVTGALLLMGIGWVGTMVSTNNAMTIGNQVSLSENKVLILEVKKDIQDIRYDMNDSRERIITLEKDMASTISSVNYLGKQHNL